MIAKLYLSMILCYSVTASAKTINVLRDGHIYFGNGTNQRSLEVSATLPEAEGAYSRILMNLSLDCPAGGCDWWDRKASVGVVHEDGGEVEIMRFMTPYRVGANWQLDVTDLQPLLSGEVRFRIFIDTWVGPGHPQGDGWLVSLGFEYKEGERQGPRPLAVIPLMAAESVEYGNPSAESGRVAEVNLPDKSSAARVWIYVTGHGQGNSENCAEFCPKRHSFFLNDIERSKTIWRDDCAATVTHGLQQGTWTYSRAGWCPGDMVTPWQVVVPTEQLSSGILTVRWQPQPYTNERADDYNNNGHTKPYYQVSALLIVYRP